MVPSGMNGDGSVPEFMHMLNAWIIALQELTNSPETAVRYRNARSRFADVIAHRLLEVTQAKRIPVVYGVWLDGHNEPTYIGQTTDGLRRLKDLPIGESHHLANTFPPEIWKRVVAVRWADVLESSPARHAPLISELQGMGLTADSIGLGVEYRMQQDLKPIFNITKRRTKGGWREVDFQRSLSIGAKIARSPELDELYKDVLDVWHTLSQDGKQRTHAAHLYGGVVYPSAIWRSQFMAE